MKTAEYKGQIHIPETYSHSGRRNTMVLFDPEQELILIYFQISMKRIGAIVFHIVIHFQNTAIAAIEE